MRKVPLTTTTSSSRPLGSIPMVYPATIRVELISSMDAVRRQLVQLHRAALDAIHAGGAARHIGALDQYLAGLGERDAGLAATKYELLLGADEQALAIHI